MTARPHSGVSAPLRALIVVTCFVALGVAGAAIATAAHPPGPLRFLAAIGLLALSQTIALNIWIGTDRLGVQCGEAALLIGLWLVPWNWLIPLVPIGVLVGQLLAGRAPVKALYNAASYTLCAALACAVVLAAGGLSAPRFDARSAAVLVAAGLAYWLSAAVFAMAAIRLARRGSGVRDLVLSNLGGKLVILVGNLVLALTVIAVGITNIRYLAFAPPLLWLVYEAYRARIRAGDERRAWQELARSIHALSRLDLDMVLDAAATGAHRLFAPDVVELSVRWPDGSLRHFRSTGGPVESVGPEPAGARPDEDDGDARALTVDGELVGELRLRYARPAERAERDRLALSAYCDALGAALRNAVSHARLREMAERKAYEADHDALTGLSSRAMLLERGDQVLRAERGATRPAMALLLFDMNNFSDVNNTLGHAAGDQLLRSTATALRGFARDGELVARLGGDEFALLVPAVPAGHTGVGYATQRGRELAEALAVPVEIAGVALSVEVSIGVVAVPVGACVMAELLRRADVAMYHAKRGGRQVAAYDPARDAASTDRLALLAEFREALTVDDQLVLQLQPVVDLSTGGPAGVEALVRWRHPRRGLLGPGEFVHVVEHSDLVGAFTRYVLDAALGVAAGWATAGLDVPVAVNMSARSLLDRRLPGEVRALLARHGLRPDHLVLEITETAVMSELEVVDDVLAALRGIGVRLSVDDFGTGYSSLTFLARFAVDEVKVDQEFVARMGESPEAAAIVRSTVELGRSLGLRVIAEGVETVEQKAALAKMGCEAGQGYHFFRPLDADKTTEVLRNLTHTAHAHGARIIPLPDRAATSE